MKKKSVRKLNLGMIKVTRLSGAQSVMGGAGRPISGPIGPSGPNTLPQDPCASQYQACTMDCTFGCNL
ncbi:MAG TPA: hypothetical protein VM802_25340 [Chitinophaga sp.]|uniref:hypothetical protein n=1 Tax=Chitinophaga sp. TaxID=1869181 RepID=UPI002CBCC842|nr:hypothetical protein [Chitinophaga sp.]HVI48217.1 hypothetical protein [Chitinophaga sp.]